MKKAININKKKSKQQTANYLTHIQETSVIVKTKKEKQTTLRIY